MYPEGIGLFITGEHCMEQPPVITTLIPTYRRPKLLERAIRSALGQTYPHVQVCVYDNASGDDTEETVLRLSSADPRVKYFRNGTNIGWLKNFMQAMEQVDTPFFSLLSDDDVLLPRFYEIALEGFNNYPEAIMSATATLRMDKAGRIIEVPLLKWRPGLYQPPDCFLSILDDMHPDWTSVVFRQDVVRKAGVLDEETGAPTDLDYLLRVAANFPVVISNEPGAIFIMHPEGYGSTPGVYTSTGWLKLIENQAGDERIPIQARTYARAVLTNTLTQKIFVLNGFHSLLAQRWDDSREAARVLRQDYGLRMKASILSALSWGCEYLPLAHRALVIMYKVKDSLKRLRVLPLQKRFGYCAKFL
ncbi:MAG: glycosyltransferase family 2 protein [Terracidiphilus sp.]